MFDVDEKIITMVKGDTLSFGLEFEDLDQDLDSVYFTCKESYQLAKALFQKSLNNGITKVGDGKYCVRISPEDTKNIGVGNYYYDFQIGVNGDIFTLLMGVLEIQPEVTTEE